jgi:hypothetical protein
VGTTIPRKNVHAKYATFNGVWHGDRSIAATENVSTIHSELEEEKEQESQS